MTIVASRIQKNYRYYRCKLCNELRLQEDFIIHLDRKHDVSLSILENDDKRGFIESLFDLNIGNALCS